MRLIMVNPNIFIVVIFTTSGMKRLGRFIPIFISHCYYVVRGRGGSRTRFYLNTAAMGAGLLSLVRALAPHGDTALFQNTY